MTSRYTRNRRLMWILFAVLVVLHHDWWFWNNGTLVFGFLQRYLITGIATTGLKG